MAQRMDDESIAEVAGRLLDARRRGAATPAAPLATEDEAYAVQDLVLHALDAGAARGARFWKSGGASREARLTHAPLPAAGVWTSPAHAGDWPFRLRGIEAEIALRLGEPVDRARAAALDAGSAAQLIDAMCVSIELVDSRWDEGNDAPPLAKLADFQSHGALVLGEWRAWAPRDWAAQRCEVAIGDLPVQRFRGTHALGDPAWLLPHWLRHATRDGASLAAGTVVTTGTWCGLLQARRGDRVHVAFEGIGEAHVAL